MGYLYSLTLTATSSPDRDQVSLRCYQPSSHYIYNPSDQVFRDRDREIEKTLFIRMLT